MSTHCADMGIICNVYSCYRHSSWISIINHNSTALEGSQLIVPTRSHCVDSAHSGQCLHFTQNFTSF